MLYECTEIVYCVTEWHEHTIIYSEMERTGEEVAHIMVLSWHISEWNEVNYRIPWLG
jgi:hypothetical protein